MTIGWKSIVNYLWRGGLTLLWNFIYDPVTARVVDFFRHPRRGRRRILAVGIVVGIIAVLFFAVLPNVSQANLAIRFATQFVGALVSLLAYVLSFVGWIFNGVVLNWSWFQKVVSFPAVEVGWDAVRDVANLSFILILLGIGFATILRVQTYHIKRLIFPFVIALLLINFSKLICGVVIDFCRVLMGAFGKSMMGSSQGDNYSGLIAQAMGIESWDKLASPDPDTWEDWAELQRVTLGFWMIAALVFAFLMLIILLISRFISLMVLTIFSPLAYAGMILPSTQGMVKKWWSSFLQKAFYGPAAVFMVWLAMYVLSSLNTDKFISRSQPSDIADLGALQADVILVFLIAIVILFKAVTISKSMGIAGASAVVGAGSSLGKGAGKKIMGGVGRGTAGMAKGAAGMLGLRNVGAYVSNMRNKLWRGQADAENERRVKNEKGVSGSMVGRDEAQQKAIMAGGGKGARGGASPAERVEAANQLMKDGKLKSKDEIAKVQRDVIDRYGSKQKQAEFKDLVKNTNIGAAGLNPDEQGTHIKRKGIDTQSNESLKENAKVILKNANRGQVDKLNDEQKVSYAEGLNNLLTDEDSNLSENEKLKAQREYARLTGGFAGLTGGDIDEGKVLEGMNAKDLGKLDKNKVNPDALKKRVQSNLDDLAIINAENPQMAKEQRDAALARVQDIEKTRGSGLLNAQGRPVGGTTTISPDDQRFLDDANRVFGRPTTP
jgi:hypothetical protein